VTAVQDHETVSIYPLDQKQIDSLLAQAGECTLNWSTKDGWPVGVIHAYVWHQGRVWITAAVTAIASRHCVANRVVRLS
jgi:hypothetical protein